MEHFKDGTRIRPCIFTQNYRMSIENWARTFLVEIKSHVWFWRPNYNRADNILKVYKVLKQVPIATNKTELLYLVQKIFHYVFQSNLRIRS